MMIDTTYETVTDGLVAIQTALPALRWVLVPAKEHE